jgi:predicted PolB exonuclease-like 3'-5' exonuclease
MTNHPENANMSPQQLYEAKAPLMAEFGKIVCLSFGKLIYPKDLEPETMPKLQVKALIDPDESNIIATFFSGVQKMIQKTTETRLVGHNIRRFDIPFLMKRAIINNLTVPKQVNPYLAKPWELSVIDSSEAWSFGAWQESFTPLKVLSEVLGIPSPKDDIDGSQVYDVYWNQNDPERVATYCNKDVVAQAKVILRIANFTRDQVADIHVEEKAHGINLSVPPAV